LDIILYRLDETPFAIFELKSENDYEKYFEDSIKKDKEIIAAMYSGSFGRNMADKFSDLDIEIIVTSKFLSNSRKNIEILLKKIGKIKLSYFIDDKNAKFLINDYQKI
jgi:predicted nucleotidyltransferase